jgi:hypothetical protein
MRMAFARDSETALAANQQYVGGVITLDSFGDIDGCTGCSVPACIVLEQVELFQTLGAAGGDIHVISDAQTRSHVTWQGGAVGGNGCPGGQAPQQVTWGSIRAIMR